MLWRTRSPRMIPLERYRVRLPTRVQVAGKGMEGAGLQGRETKLSRKRPGEVKVLCILRIAPHRSQYNLPGHALGGPTYPS
jgi:hypothetical protein